MNWFTADTHFNHDNIRTYCQRPFKSVEHMDRELIRRWNERVAPIGDTVFHLGDFGFRTSEWVVPPSGDLEFAEKIKRGYFHYANQLNGKIILIRGNHDSSNDIKSPLVAAVLNYGGIDWWMQHEPVAQFKFNLCGHVHGLWRVQQRGPSTIVNVGVDVWDFRPVSINEIIKAVNEEKGVE